MSNVGPGQRLLHYELVDRIGEGGMGVVWKARDTVLDRHVAIKILPDVFSADAERMARFEREARLLGSINHANIATIYGLHEDGAVHFIAMELIDGESLAERVARGALPLDDAAGVARQVAEALEAAHERGVVHRDLKPANICLTEEGQVKVLDFGLAKSVVGRGLESVDTELSPTVTSDRTRAGTILGTAPYMSPEQARGHAVDKRTDIWAFGCILFEMLTGVRAFRGEAVTDVLAEVLKTDPPWNLLPHDTPLELSRLIRRCLVKSQHDRLHDVADARLVIDDLRTHGSAPEVAPPVSRRAVDRRPGFRRLSLLSAVAVVAALLAGFFAGRSTGPSTPPIQGSFSIELPEGLELALDVTVPFALSPDGTRIVFVGIDESGRRLYGRRFDRFEVEPIAGTEGAIAPVFSPDGEWIAFTELGGWQLKKIAAAGGAAMLVIESPRSQLTVFDGTNLKGLHWGTDDRIVLTPSYTTGLWVVDVREGTVLHHTEPDREAREKTHRYPHLLPDGDAVMFMRGTVDLYTYDEAEIELLDLSDGTRRRLIEDGTSPAYVSSGHLLFARDGALFAAPFEPRKRELTGAAVKVVDDITTLNSSGTAFYATSPTGHLAYLPGGQETFDRELVFVDRGGKTRPSGLDPAQYSKVSVSPSGRKLALEIQAANDNIWVHDLARGASTRLTSAWDNERPVWTSDGRSVLYHTASAQEQGVDDILVQPADGSSAAEILIANGTPVSVARQGGQLAFHRDGDIWVLDPEQQADPFSFVSTRFRDSDPGFSPDGRWLAYVSDESQREEVYVVPYPEKSERWQVSAGGGECPRWSPDGSELYYMQTSPTTTDSSTAKTRRGQTMMVVEVETGSELSVGAPRVLFELDPHHAYDACFDVFPDGRFAMIRQELRRRTSIRVVLNWLDRLKDRPDA